MGAKVLTKAALVVVIAISGSCYDLLTEIDQPLLVIASVVLAKY